MQWTSGQRGVSAEGLEELVRWNSGLRGVSEEGLEELVRWNSGLRWVRGEAGGSGGSPCDEGEANKTSGAQAKLMHRVAGGWKEGEERCEDREGGRWRREVGGGEEGGRGGGGRWG